MVCKKCGQETPDDSLFCKNCGKKVAEKKLEPKEIFKRVSAIFLVIITVFLIIIFGSKIVKQKEPDVEIEALETESTDDTNEEVVSESIQNSQEVVQNTNVIPKDTITKKNGFGTEQFITKDTLFYISTDKKAVYKTSFDGKDVSKIYSGDASNLFFKNDYLYIQSKDSITKLDTKTNTSETLVSKNDIYNFFVIEEFVFYGIKVDENLNNLFRINIDGKNDMLIKDNIYLYHINVRDNSIIYTQLIDVKKDEELSPEKTKIVIDNENGNKSLAFFTCDFSGETEQVVMEIITNEINPIEITQFIDLSVGIRNAFSLLGESQGKKNFYYADMASNLGFFLEDIEDIIYSDEEIYLVSKSTENSELFELSKYVPGDNIKTKITELPEYNDIFVKDNNIYITLNENLIITMDILGENKKGFFDGDSFDIVNLGNFIDGNMERIFLENAIINMESEEFIYLNRTNDTIETYVYSGSEYPVITEELGAYFNYLLTGGFFNKNYVFATADMNSDGAYELFLGEEGGSLVGYNPYFENVKSTDIYYFDEKVKSFSKDFTDVLENECKFYKDMSEDGIIVFSEGEDFSEIYRLTIAGKKISGTPILRTEETDDGFYYYEYIGKKFTSLTETEYNNRLLSIEKELSALNLYKINIEDIIKGIYFNSHDNQNYIR